MSAYFFSSILANSFQNAVGTAMGRAGLNQLYTSYTLLVKKMRNF